MKSIKVLFITMIATLSMQAQEDISYQNPPQEILELVDVQRAPNITIDKKGECMLFLYRDMYLSLEELNEEELRLGGLRINPTLNIRTANRYFNRVEIKRFDEQTASPIAGLPENAKITHISWSPDKKQVAFTHTTTTGVELWVIDVAQKRAHRLTSDNLNANMGVPFTWLTNSKQLLVRQLPEDRGALLDQSKELPTGPVTQNASGKASHNRTYQDLLKNKIDETNFEHLVESSLYLVDLKGEASLWAPKAMYTSERFSPDGEYVIITAIERPFSYSVPLSRFPQKSVIYDKQGKLVCEFNHKPLIEELPKGFMSTHQGKRNISWRADQPSTIYWVEALDEGDPAIEVEYRDAVYQVKAPFDGQPQLLTKTRQRYAGITWGHETKALLYDRWWDTRNSKTYVFNPSNPTESPVLLFDRNYQDIYSDPGHASTEENQYGRQVLQFKGNSIYLIGEGHSEKGKFPFVHLFNLDTKKSTTLYQSKLKDKDLSILSILDAKKGTLLASIESPTEYPNYYTVRMRDGKSRAITSLVNPFAKMDGVSKELIKYKRKDGVELSGTLYLPKGYDKTKGEKLPMIMWAYPTEYKDKASAGQTDANPNSFTYPYWGSPLYWVMRGYAVLDDAAFPIVGEGDEEPNDTFIEQLVMNAEAAIDAVDALGVLDRDRVAVGGHSYGAFMTANLLTHSDLFAAGIARSGAYNRTLTPFGFQLEQRNYWEAKEVYDTMSPFMHADKMKTPMLLIHGAADNNAGTHTMQSERYFGALKGVGAPVRLVLLPNESHGYAAKENILHMLWEQDQWLEQYVKNRKTTKIEE